MSNPNEQRDSAPIEGPKNLSGDDFESSTVPEPKIQEGRFQCPMCSRFFDSKQGYYTHARKKHQVGSAISTPIY